MSYNFRPGTWTFWMIAAIVLWTFSIHVLVQSILQILNKKKQLSEFREPLSFLHLRQSLQTLLKSKALELEQINCFTLAHGMGSMNWFGHLYKLL